MMKVLTHPVIVDQTRLDVQVLGANGEMVRPLLTVMLSEQGPAMAMMTSQPYAPAPKGAIERALSTLADAVASEIGGGEAPGAPKGTIERVLSTLADAAPKNPFRPQYRVSMGRAPSTEILEGLLLALPRKQQRFPAFWSDVEVRQTLIGLHRQVPIQIAIDACAERHGWDRTPSRSAIGRFWRLLDLARGAKWSPAGDARPRPGHWKRREGDEA